MRTELPASWSKRALGSVAARVRRKLNGTPRDIAMITSTKGFVLQSDKYDRYMAGESLQNYVELHRGEFAYNKGNSKTYPQGCIYQLNNWDAAAVPNVYFSFAIDAKQLDHRFASQFFAAGGLNSQLSRIITSGARSNGLLNISIDDFFACEIPLPPLPEQKKIAEILGSVDDAIRATEAVIDQTRRVKEGLLQELLTNGIGHTKFKQTEIGEIPEAWKLMALGSVADIVRGSTPRPARDPRYFGGTFMPWVTVGLLPKDDNPTLMGTPTFLTEAGAERSRILPKGTVILSNSGYGCGVPKILGIEGCANDGIAAFLGLDASVEPHFLYYFLFSKTHWLRTKVARGVDQPNLNTDLIAAVVMPVPPLDEQRAIVDAISVVSDQLDHSSRVLDALRTAKAGLLQDLLTGKVRVKP